MKTSRSSTSDLARNWRDPIPPPLLHFLADRCTAYLSDITGPHPCRHMTDAEFWPFARDRLAVLRRRRHCVPLAA